MTSSYQQQQQQQQRQQQQFGMGTAHAGPTTAAVSISAATPAHRERSMPVSVRTSPYSSPIGDSAVSDRSAVVGLAQRAENVATNASDMLHLLTSKHANLLRHVRGLTSQLEEAQGRLVEMEGAHRGEVEAMEEAHHKILMRLRDIGGETSSLNEAVRRKTHVAVAKAVHEMTEVLSRERKLRAKAEASMKDYRERVEEWEVALGDADERARSAGRRAEKMTAKIEKLKETLYRAKTRIAKLETDRSSLRDVVRTNRWREAQLAEQAATQAEIQVRHLCSVVHFCTSTDSSHSPPPTTRARTRTHHNTPCTTQLSLFLNLSISPHAHLQVRTLSALRQEVEADTWILSQAGQYPSPPPRPPTATADPLGAMNSRLDDQIVKSSTVHHLQRQIDAAKSNLAGARESLRLQQIRYEGGTSMPSSDSRLSMRERLSQHRTMSPLETL
jgi:hypothetical protein